MSKYVPTLKTENQVIVSSNNTIYRMDVTLIDDLLYENLPIR